MPSLISKILHRKHRSTSRSPERNGLNEDARSKRASMPPVSRNDATTPSSRSPRRSMDSPSGHSIIVEPKRRAPPPPTDETVVISQQDDHSDHHISKSVLPVTAPLSEEISPTTVPLTDHHPSGAAGSNDRSSTTPSFTSAHPRDGWALQEVKSVEGRRDRPKMSSGPLRQSVEGELGRHSSDQLPRLSTDTRSNDGGRYEGDRDHDIAEENGAKEGSRTSDDMARKSASITRDSEGNARMSGEGVRRSEDLPRKSVEVPARNSSLALQSLDGSSDPIAQNSRGMGEADTGGLEDRMKGLSLEELQSPALVKQRMDMVHQVMGGAAERRKARGDLTEQGLHTFNKAGMSELVGKEDTVDVHTKWLKPIIQEKIIPRIHTEYTTIIEQEIHHHHVYPKIQPIEDPNPIVLPPLHRIFSPATGNWHEVQGDQAAIDILGEDVFNNGPKDVRIARRPYSETEEHEGGIAALTKGLEGRDLTEEGFGTGGKGKVVEREGLLGQDLGDWKDVGRGVIFGKKRDNESEL